MEMMDTILGLVSHYSPSGQEHDAVEWLVAHMQTIGYDRAYIDAAGNAVGVLGQGPRQVVLLGHIDTVSGEIPVRLEDGVLYGRGAVDAKGALASFVDAVAKTGHHSGWQWIVIGVVEEETTSIGARFAASQYKPDFVIVGEPNNWERVALGYKGSAWATLTMKQEQAHTASGGQTACETAVAAWQIIQREVEVYNAGKTRAFEKVLPALRGMSSGEDGFEQWSQLRIGCRLPLAVNPQQWYAWLAEMAPGMDLAPEGEAIPAWAGEKNSRLVRALLSGIRSQGGKPSFVVKTGTADVNIVAPAWQCPALVYGPGDSSLDHTPHEQLSLEEYHKAVCVLGSALEELSRIG